VTEKIADHRQSLYPEEMVLISGVIEKRAHEFSTGRFCAHQALLEYGIDHFPVLRGEQREPVWPENIVGSISHCRDLAGAVVARAEDIKSVGLDIESRKQLNPAIARHICTEEEKCWLVAQDPLQQNLALLVIFSIKEAIFKCVYQQNGAQLLFRQCCVTPDIQKERAKLEIRAADITIQPGELSVHIHINSNHVYSGVIWHHLPAVG
jgi:4'-phosphopantetheinyl transferase EntD